MFFFNQHRNFNVPGLLTVYTQFMATKTINIKESAYQALKSMKHDGESLSDVIIRLSHGDRKTVTDFVRSLSPDLREEAAASVISVKKELDEAHPREGGVVSIVDTCFLIDLIRECKVSLAV